MGNTQTTIYVIINNIITWYGFKILYHVINMVWDSLLSYTTLTKTLYNNYLQYGMPIPRMLYHVFTERGMGPLIYIRDHTIPRSKTPTMKALRISIAILLSQAITLAVFFLATTSLPLGWTTAQIIAYIILSVYYAAVFIYILRTR